MKMGQKDNFMERNNLYPIFLKTKNLNVLIVGGGFVAEEKLTFLLKSSPDAKVLMVSPLFREGTIELAKKGCVTLVEDVYKKKHLQGRHIVVATTDIPEVNVQVWKDCRAEAKLVNVADNPPYCDFYMGGIVTKGNVKIPFLPTENRQQQPKDCVNFLKMYFQKTSMIWLRI